MSSFGPSQATQSAESNLGNVSNLATGTILPNALNLFNTTTGLAGPQLQAGQSNVQSGTNFLNTVLNGNRANTTSLLQPNIDQIRQNNQNSLQAISTLMPRGGGRSGALFQQSLAPSSSITSLFNNARTGAATALPQIGLQQEGIGTNLFNLGTNALQAGSGALGAASGANSQLGNLGLQQQQLTNNLFSSLGSGIFGLLTAPLTGGSSLLSKIPNLFQSGTPGIPDAQTGTYS